MDYTNLLPRFLRYVAVDTQSDENSAALPTSKGQTTLLAMLAQELRAMGIEHTEMDERGCVMARIPANIAANVAPVGFIAHVDTSPDMSGADIQPQIIENYDGGDITLCARNGIVLSAKEFPELRDYTGQTLITTRGSTLLGADDKAGIAEIMTMAEHIVQNPSLPHGDICIAFTSDEEIGRGVDFFDTAKFGARYAYSVDGGPIGELEYENFNAALANINIQGKNIHPGYAKDKMLNALHLAMEFAALLPPAQRPEYTQGREGFFHLIHCGGGVEKAQMRYLVRDHDSARFEERKKFIEQCVRHLNAKYGSPVITADIADQYYNMRQQVEPHFHIVQAAVSAMERAGVKPLIRPIRGGTDGARLSFMGLPCPNLFAGGHNFHGKYEFVPLQSMQKAVEVLVNIVNIFAAQ